MIMKMLEHTTSMCFVDDYEGLSLLNSEKGKQQLVEQEQVGSIHHKSICVSIGRCQLLMYAVLLRAGK